MSSNPKSELDQHPYSELGWERRRAVTYDGMTIGVVEQRSDGWAILKLKTGARWNGFTVIGVYRNPTAPYDVSYPSLLAAMAACQRHYQDIDRKEFEPETPSYRGAIHTKSLITGEVNDQSAKKKRGRTK